MTSIVFKAIQKLPQSIAKLKKALKASQKPKAARSYQPDSYFYGRSRNIDKELAVLKADGLTSEDVIRATKAIEARRTAGQKGYIKRLKKRDKKVIKYNKGQVVSQKALDKKRIKSLKASDKALEKRRKVSDKALIERYKAGAYDWMPGGKRQNIKVTKTYAKERKKGREDYYESVKARNKVHIKLTKKRDASRQAIDKNRIKSLKASDKALAKRSKAREKDIIKATGKRQNIISFKTFLKKRKKRRAEEIDPLVDPKGAAKQRHKEIKKRYGVKGRPGKYRVKKHWTEWISRGYTN